MQLSGCSSSSFAYKGRVTKIKAAPLQAGPVNSYLVETEVLELIEGTYKKKTCSLSMMDPYLSGIKEGSSYTFHVKREGLKYIPDEFQLKLKLYK